jgi:hypothetical protein
MEMAIKFPFARTRPADIGGFDQFHLARVHEVSVILRVNAVINYTNAVVDRDATVQIRR